MLQHAIYRPRVASKPKAPWRDLSDREWSTVAHLLPPERGRMGRPAYDNRVVLNGILWRLHTGVAWRRIPKTYGKWNSIYRRFERWQESGVWRRVASVLRAQGR